MPLPISILLYFVVTAPVGILNGIISAAGEEIGWRGFLTPRLLAKTRFFHASMIGGIIWAVWHYPLFFRNAGASVQLIVPMICFTLCIVGACFFATWLRIQSGSVWAPIIFHASHNRFLSMFNSMTVSTALTERYADETGILLATCGVILAIVFTRLSNQQLTTPLGDPSV